MNSYLPLGNDIVLRVERPNEEVLAKLGLVVPESAQAGSSVGIVIARGPLVYEDVQVGIRVLFQPFLARASWREDGQVIVVVTDTEVYGVVSDV